MLHLGCSNEHTAVAMALHFASSGTNHGLSAHVRKATIQEGEGRVHAYMAHYGHGCGFCYKPIMPSWVAYIGAG